MALTSKNPAYSDRWMGRRYYPISQYFKNLFGERIAKIAISVSEACPNRRIGSKLEPCIFCDEWGSAAYHREASRDLLDQIRFNKGLVTRRHKAKNFLVYFQSYTNTLDKLETLAHRYQLALTEPDIKGLVIGTRPDCLPDRLMPVFEDISTRRYLMIEIGAQSFFDDQLFFLKRGHTSKTNIQAIQKLSDLTHADIGVHLIFGQPNDTKSRIIETAQRINELPVNNVKLHNLHVLKNTELANLYFDGEFIPDCLEEYTEKVILFLRHLSPKISVQRLAGLASRWDELVAPGWTREKMRPIDFIESRMRQTDCYQGDLF